MQDQAWAKSHVEVLLGRIPGTPGAHTKGHNHDSLGICVVGNFDAEPPAFEVWNETLRLVRWLLSMYDLTKLDVYGHRDFATKTCPGKRWDMDLFRKQL